MNEPTSVSVLTGAGVSTDSGIPDFRGPQGVWTKNPQAAASATIDRYVADPEVRRAAWQARLGHAAWAARPNAAHRALVDLERAGLLRALITQNIDELHQRAGSAPEKVIELHGTLHRVECLTCDLITPMAEVLERVAAGEQDPLCPRCGGLQKSNTISFGQNLKAEVLRAAQDAARSCDVFVAVGTSLTVHPAAGLCGEALDAGARLVIVNAEPTPYDPFADRVVNEPIGQALPALVKELIDETR
ncbi:Sir2 family NAD-dependent protein deacetylase [Nonomuraea sp. MG754425]|uniref:SIR2 family NAD-dependent protein deacylase n=1 Tax=Nonomuraea sp. MG754425 TaxID=2570319 RepID=UPI001F34D308|nr:Sir2 family NAD-dependent protein deacetylase [Nonomuraea sp. MG754425]